MVSYREIIAQKFQFGFQFSMEVSPLKSTIQRLLL